MCGEKVSYQHGLVKTKKQTKKNNKKQQQKNNKPSPPPPPPPPPPKKKKKKKKKKSYLEIGLTFQIKTTSLIQKVTNKVSHVNQSTESTGGRIVSIRLEKWPWTGTWLFHLTISFL